MRTRTPAELEREERHAMVLSKVEHPHIFALDRYLLILVRKVGPELALKWVADLIACKTKDGPWCVSPVCRNTVEEAGTRCVACVDAPPQPPGSCVLVGCHNDPLKGGLCGRCAAGGGPCVYIVEDQGKEVCEFCGAPLEVPIGPSASAAWDLHVDGRCSPGVQIEEVRRRRVSAN